MLDKQASKSWPKESLTRWSYMSQKEKEAHLVTRRRCSTNLYKEERIK